MLGIGKFKGEENHEIDIDIEDNLEESMSIEEKEEKVKEDFEKLSDSLIKDPEKVDKIIKSIRDNKVIDFGMMCDVTNGTSDRSIHEEYKDRLPKNRQIKIVFLRNSKEGKKIKKFIDQISPSPEKNYDDTIDKLSTYLKSECLNYEIDYKNGETRIITYRGEVIYGKKYFMTSGDFYGLSQAEYKNFLLDLRITVDVLIQIDPYIDELGNSVKPINKYI